MDDRLAAYIRIYDHPQVPEEQVHVLIENGQESFIVKDSSLE